MITGILAINQNAHLKSIHLKLKRNTILNVKNTVYISPA